MKAYQSLMGLTKPENIRGMTRYGMRTYRAGAEFLCVGGRSVSSLKQRGAIPCDPLAFIFW